MLANSTPSNNMKSPMVGSLEKKGIIKDDGKSYYTELQVLKSPAGYYIGTLYWDAEMKFWDAGSRDSDYYITKEEAEKDLANLNWEQRMTP